MIDNCLKYNGEFLLHTDEKSKHLTYNITTHTLSMDAYQVVTNSTTTVNVLIYNGFKDSDYQIVNGTETITIHTDTGGDYSGKVTITTPSEASDVTVYLIHNGVEYANTHYSAIENHGLPIEYRFNYFVDSVDKEYFREAGYGFSPYMKVDNMNNGVIGICLPYDKTQITGFDSTKYCIPPTLNYIDCCYDSPDDLRTDPGKYVNMTAEGYVYVAGITFVGYTCTIPSWPYNAINLVGIDYDNTRIKAPVLCNANGEIYNYKATH